VDSTTLELFDVAAGSLTMAAAVALLPAALQSRLNSGELQMACFGQTRNMESPLEEGDRIELLGPVVLDVKAERSARVRAARARARGPYNRSFSGSSGPKES
jgi:putative ubiquitin-RnfH superfamily antitoxin RatB of RatAB toxin-antitoxin module